jgi:hypothetical protein
MQDKLDAHEGKIMVDNIIMPVRAWDAAAQIACPKIKVNLNGNEDERKYFQKFVCVMGECNQCPKWNDHVSNRELNCTDPICYCVFGAYYKCTVMDRRISNTMRVTQHIVWRAYLTMVKRNQQSERNMDV